MAGRMGAFVGHMDSVVAPVDQVDDDLDDGVFLLRPALGDQEGQCDQSVVGQALGAVGAVEDAVAGKEIDEDGGGDALVAVAEGVVLDDEVKKIGGLLLDAWIKLLAVEGLVDGAEGALESLVLLDAEQSVESPPSWHGQCRSPLRNR